MQSFSNLKLMNNWQVLFQGPDKESTPASSYYVSSSQLSKDKKLFVVLNLAWGELGTPHQCAV